jgi:hypothetical protein
MGTGVNQSLSVEGDLGIFPVLLIGAGFLPWKIRGKGGACAIACDAP